MNDIIVGMGEALWDVLPEGKKIGGAPTNFAYHVSQFGFDSRVVSAVGEDKLGNEILKNFDAKKLNYLIEKVPYPTGTVQVELDPNGVPMYDIKENVAWDNIPFTSALEELAKKTRSVCFGSLAQRSVVSRETINSFLNAMPDGEGQCKIFDVNLRQGFYTKEILCNSMKRCNILKINDEELVTVSRMFGYPGIDLQAVALRGVEIAAAHPNIAYDVFEGFFHRQVAERNPAPGDFQIGDLQHRSRSRSGFRSRFGDGLFGQRFAYGRLGGGRCGFALRDSGRFGFCNRSRFGIRDFGSHFGSCLLHIFSSLADLLLRSRKNRIFSSHLNTRF